MKNLETKFKYNLYLDGAQKRLKELGLHVHWPVKVELKFDKSKYGMELCEELLEVFAQDEQAKARFEKLSPGKQRNIIHYIGSVKNSDKRVDRALKLLENLKHLQVGKESFRQILGIQE